MGLPYPTKVILPFDIATAQDMNERHANDVALAAGSGLDDDAVTTNKIANQAVTADKIDFTTLNRYAVGTVNTTNSTVTVTGLGFEPKIIRFFLLRTDSAYAIMSQGVSLGTTVHRGSSMYNRITGTTGTGNITSTSSSLLMGGVGGATIAAGYVSAVGPDGFTITMTTAFNANWTYEAEG